jgi:hypothetical protein
MHVLMSLVRNSGRLAKTPTLNLPKKACQDTQPTQAHKMSKTKINVVQKATG